MPEDFTTYIASEVERLNERRNAALEARRQAEEELDAIDTEFRAINAYQDAKTGKRPSPSRMTNGSGRRHTVQRRGSRRADLVKLIGEHAGLRRQDILEKLGLKGDKTGEMSVSNALTAMIKANQLKREDGLYHVAA
jgi:hypothetical protein